MLGAALAVAAAGGTRPASAAEIPAEGQVHVLLASGRHFTAELDQRTDAARLWLRWGQGTSVILRPIDWDRVVRVEMAGETFSGDVVHQAVILVRQEAPFQDRSVATGKNAHPTAAVGWAFLPDGGRRGFETASNSDTGGQAASGACAAEPAWPPGLTGTRRLAPAATPARVRALEVEARLGKWGPDVDADGLVVEISPLDAQGELVPVQGTVEVELTGQGASQTAGGEFATLGHWVRCVWPEDFGYRGARCRLPFQAVQPEFDLRWASKGMVHVRLSVPGEGVFEATDAVTRIRPASGVRDNYQETTGRRFLPNERTSRSASY